MLFLILKLGSDRYAIEIRQVVEILPLVCLKQMPNAPWCVAGVLNYHSAPVPVIDLSRLATGMSSRSVMSTRIILTNYQDQSGETHILGLMAENVYETLRRDEADFVSSGIAVEGSPYLGSVTVDAGGIIQKIEIQSLLTAEARAAIFTEKEMA